MPYDNAYSADWTYLARAAATGATFCVSAKNQGEAKRAADMVDAFDRAPRALDLPEDLALEFSHQGFDFYRCGEFV